MVTAIVLANGCFDPLHYGHLLHLEQARTMGDRLVVALTSDRAIRREKGPDRPLFNQTERSTMLSALRCVYQVVIFDSELNALPVIAPQIFVKGIDYVGRIDKETEQLCASLGIAIRFTDTPKYSATGLIRELRRSQAA